MCWARDSPLSYITSLVFHKDKFSLESPRVAWNSRSSCLCLPSAGITGMYHHAGFISVF
jgi:hypothetical protein